MEKGAVNLKIDLNIPENKCDMENDANMDL